MFIYCVFFLCLRSVCVSIFFFFFFLKHKTAYGMRISDGSSDVCSSDLRRMRSSCPHRLKPWFLQIGAPPPRRKPPVRQITSLFNAKGLGFVPKGMGRTAAMKTAPCRHRAGTARSCLCLGDW